ncbi:MAG: methyltransferase domain-containing protein [Gammaproteobacteria bacterium]
MRITPYLKMLNPAEMALRRQRCPLCAFPFLLRLGRQERAVRCARCRAGPIHLSLAAVIRDERPDLGDMKVYEMSSRGPLCRMLARDSGALQLSEYFEDVPPGECRDGVTCQDVQQLTFPDGSFDLCTSSEVFEHVPDDGAGFRELRRVLRPGGQAIFTVPLMLDGPTVERAELRSGTLVHHLPPEYHDDCLRGPGRVLAFRTYGADITRRLEQAGFRAARIETRYRSHCFGYGRPVVVASR